MEFWSAMAQEGERNNAGTGNQIPQCLRPKHVLYDCTFKGVYFIDCNKGDKNYQDFTS
jgi:hypothetical protein